MMMNSIFLADPDRALSSKITNDIVKCMLLEASKTDPAPVTESPLDDCRTSHRMVEVQIQTGKTVAFLSHYDSWCRLLESTLAQHSRVIVWHLFSDENMLSPTPSYGRLCAMLALSFPDILFKPIKNFADIVQTTKLWDVAFSPFFDGAGIRDNIRKDILEKNRTETTNVNVDYLPLRSKLAVAIDDEDAYALLHGYTTYRFGFKAVPISTGTLANLIFPKDQASLLGYAELTIEDLYISFPDQEGKNLSDLEKRKEEWPHLGRAKRRVFVTSDHDRSKWRSNQPFLNKENARGIDIRKLHKPHAGMFLIWESAGLTSGLRWTEDGKVHDGHAPGFVWPPKKLHAEENEDGHSSPGTLKMLAEHMLERAERMIPNVQSVADAVKGAVLANDALELLGTRTPTLAIEALRLKHQFEVLAECQFSGVEYHIPLHGRLAEIRRDVRVISQWFGYKQRESAAMNAEMAILTTLVRVFRDFGQFDEEQQCMQRARHLNNSLWMGQRPIRRTLWPVLRYLELLLSSFSTFVLILMAWILVLGVLFWLSQAGSGLGDFFCGLQNSVSSFFSMGSPVTPSSCTGTNNWPGAVVTSLAIFSGFVHIGVFVSHLYSIVTRR